MPDATLQAVQPAVRWLMKRQNRNGGFSSSQDTVLGLQAMSRFAVMTYDGQAGIDNTLIVSGADFDHTYNIHKDNAIIWDTRIVKTIPNDIAVTSKGSGCVVATSQLRYNLPKIPGEAGFDFNITFEKGSTVEHLNLQLCITYERTGGQPSSMAIVELDLLSGYVASKPSLTALSSAGKARLYEVSGDKVILYFNEFTTTPTCYNVVLDRDTNVENLKPSTAKVYDYYKGEDQKSITYERPSNLPSDLDNV